MCAEYLYGAIIQADVIDANVRPLKKWKKSAVGPKKVKTLYGRFSFSTERVRFSTPGMLVQCLISFGLVRKTKKNAFGIDPLRLVSRHWRNRGPADPELRLCPLKSIELSEKNTEESTLTVNVNEYAFNLMNKVPCGC